MWARPRAGEKSRPAVNRLANRWAARIQAVAARVPGSGYHAAGRRSLTLRISAGCLEARGSIRGTGAAAVSLSAPGSPSAIVNRSAVAETRVTDAPDGVRIAYDRWGQSGPALVYIHGWCCNRRYWRHQPELMARSWRRLFIDLAGHGQSEPRAAVTLEAYAADVAAMLACEQVEQAILIGHSMGGIVALHAAAAAPGRILGLIGIDTFRQPTQRLSAEQIDTTLAGLQADFPSAVTALVKTRMFTPGLDQALAETVAAAMAAESPETGIAAQRALLGAGYGDLLRARAGLPMGLINADYAPTDTAALKERCPRLEISIIPGNSHFPMLERPSSFNPLLEAHIRRIAVAAERGSAL